MRDLGHRGAAFGEEHQLRAAVARVRATLDVAGALELTDRLYAIRSALSATRFNIAN
jgi:hypothetical protein